MKKNTNIFHRVTCFFIHFWCINRYHLIRNGDKMQIRSNPLKEPSLSVPITCFMHRPSPGDPHRTSNISHKTQQKRKSATETRNVLLLTKAGHSLLKSSKELHFFPASLHVSCVILEGCGFFFFFTWWLIARGSVLWSPNIMKCHFCHFTYHFWIRIAFYECECVWVCKSVCKSVCVCLRVCESESLCNCVWVRVKSEFDPPDSALQTCISKKRALVLINWTCSLLKLSQDLE